MSKVVNIGAVGDNCMDVYEKEGKYYPGGNPVNVAVYLKRLGGNAAYIGAVGDDEYGPKMIEAVAAKGVDTSHLRTIEGGETSKSYVEIVDGDRQFVGYDQGVNAILEVTEEDIEFLKGFDLVIAGIYSNVVNQLGKLKDAGLTVAMDFSDEREDDPRVSENLIYPDYAFFSYDDDDVEEFMKRVYRPNMKVLVCTQGEKGSVAYDGENFFHHGIIEVDNLADTMGAGDSFIAGFLYRTVLGGTIEECMDEGAANSAITIQYDGAW